MARSIKKLKETDIPKHIADGIRALAKNAKAVAVDEKVSRKETHRGSARARVLGITTGEGRFVSAPTLARNGYAVEHSDGEYAVRIAKAMQEGDPVALADIQREITEDLNPSNTSRYKTVPPPWNFDLMVDLLTLNTTHAACIETVACDYAYSPWELCTHEWAKTNVPEAELAQAKREVEAFIKTAALNRSLQNLCRDVSIDYGALGSGGFEILRDRRGFIGGVNYIPFNTMRVLRKDFAQRTGAKYLQQRFQKTAYFVELNAHVKYTDRNGVPFDPVTAPVEDFPAYAQRAAHVRYTDTFTHHRNAEETVRLEDAANEFVMLARPPFTLSTIYGTPAGYTAINSMRAQVKIDEFNMQFFASKGVPQFAVVFSNLAKPSDEEDPSVTDDEIEQMSPSQAAQLEQQIELFFRNKLAESDRSVLMLELYGDTKVKFEKLNNNKFEASFAEYEKRNYEKVRLAHRVPNAAIGVEGENAGLGGTRDLAQMQRYHEHIVRPGQAMWEDVINTLIRCGLMIPYFKFEFKPVNKEEEAAERVAAREEFLAGGILLNEYRERIGREPLPENVGNVFFVPSGRVAVAAGTAMDPRYAVANALTHERELRRTLSGSYDDEEDLSLS